MMHGQKTIKSALQFRYVQLLYVNLVRENAMSGLIILASFPYKVNEFIINHYLKVVLRLFPSRAPRSRVEADNLPPSTEKSAPTPTTTTDVPGITICLADVGGCDLYFKGLNFNGQNYFNANEQESI
jgi:hypothetical protein